MCLSLMHSVEDLVALQGSRGPSGASGTCIHIVAPSSQQLASNRRDLHNSESHCLARLTESWPVDSALIKIFDILFIIGFFAFIFILFNISLKH